MDLFIALLVGLIAGVGTTLLLHRNLFRILLGLALVAQAANVLVFVSAGLGNGTTAIIAKGASTLPDNHPDPLAQALVLTAIVISFGVLAFCLSLLKKRDYRHDKSDISSLADVES